MKTEMGTEEERDGDCETKGIWAGRGKESSTEQQRNRCKLLRWRKRARETRERENDGKDHLR